MVQRKEQVLELDLLRLLKILRHKAWLLLLSMLLGGALVLGGTVLFVPPAYQASVLLYITSSSADKDSISQGELTAAQSLTDTYAVILKSRTTLTEVIARSGVSFSQEELEKMISAASVNNTEVLRIDVEAPTAGDALAIANAVTQVLPERLAAIVEGSAFRIVDEAEMPEKMASPNYALNTVFGVLLGALLPAAVLLFREWRNGTIREPEDIAQICDLPVLAAVPNLLLPQESAYGYGRAQELDLCCEVR